MIDRKRVERVLSEAWQRASSQVQEARGDTTPSALPFSFFRRGETGKDSKTASLSPTIAPKKRSRLRKALIALGIGSAVVGGAAIATAAFSPKVRRRILQSFERADSTGSKAQHAAATVKAVKILNP